MTKLKISCDVRKEAALGEKKGKKKKERKEKKSRTEQKKG